MKIAFFDAHNYEKSVFDQENEKFGFQINYFEFRMSRATADIAKGYKIVCGFVGDTFDKSSIRSLASHGVKLIALRSAGFNNVDLKAAWEHGIKVVRVPDYSPYAVAEHAVGLILALNRKFHRAYGRVREHNFSLEGLVGFDLHGKRVGLLGGGKIGSVMAKIMRGFGCEVVIFDKDQDPCLKEKHQVTYLPLDVILKTSDIISLHLPLTPSTRHIINFDALKKMKEGSMLINTGRGALIDTSALIKSLKSGQLGFAGLDVYEEEEGVFFKDLSDQVLQDDCLSRLLTFPNVLITSHQAFLTKEALTNIANTTLKNIDVFSKGKALQNEVNVKANVK